MILQELALKTDYLTSYSVFFSFVAIVLIFLYALKKTRFVLIAFLTISLASIIVYILKNIFETPRPQDAIIDITSYAFPSGHATLSAATACLLIWIILKEQMSKILRWVLILFSILATGWITYTRLILKVHTFNQVFVGILIGILVFFIVLLSEKIFKKS